MWTAPLNKVCLNLKKKTHKHRTHKLSTSASTKMAEFSTQTKPNVIKQKMFRLFHSKLLLSAQNTTSYVNRVEEKLSGVTKLKKAFELHTTPHISNGRQVWTADGAI
ncbi:hypothetical protein CHARACLAT_033481 [Characodon lateralis]|uniref:Uncharacterized protein n=1 Tax=Characodon lateralis TaxID=208331 RepID=A0ABU7DZH9_9TELE|nr:hypothetical protein [Characodon lateralis]